MMHFIQVTQYLDVIVFSLYCVIFVITVLTFKTGLIRFQIGQLVWTLVTVAMVVLQTKFLANCALYGVFWFFFPMATVVSNDVFAYVCGMACGRKFINAPFLSLSPKKTWEGFIGAAIITCIFSFFFPLLLADIPWFICPVEKLSFIPQSLASVSCEPHAIFLPQEYIIPSFTFMGGVVGGYAIELRPIQLHGIAYGVFASLVAPFGGFLASAIKRGYDIKDFDKIIPGHGGMMDRMDCQLIIHLFTFVHLKSFVMTPTSTAVAGGMGGIVAAAAMLSPADLAWVHARLGVMLEQVE
jgi:phosphatidate cytidylyltransferase